jgi:hypothetical protein
MNKRLLELAKESGLIQYDSDGKVQDAKKFAELIITECMEIVLESDPSPKMSLDKPYGTIIDNIKVHFGLSD